MIKNKKGDVTEVPFFVTIMIVLSVCFIVVLFVNNILAGVIDHTQLNQSAAYPRISHGINKITTTTGQQGFVIIFAFLIIGMIGSSFFVREHPIALALYIIVTAFTIFVAVIGQNLYDQIVSNSILHPIAQQQVMINNIMTHLNIITMCAAFLSMIIIFSKVVSTPVIGGGDI